MSITRALVAGALWSGAAALPVWLIATVAAVASPACSSCLLDIPSLGPDLIFTAFVLPVGLFNVRVAHFVRDALLPLAQQLRACRKLECVVLASGNLYSRTSRLHVTAYHMQAIADHTHRQSMA